MMTKPSEGRELKHSELSSILTERVRLSASELKPAGSEKVRVSASELERLGIEGLTWDCFIKGASDGEWYRPTVLDRTRKERKGFSKALSVMLNLYASITGTAVIQVKDWAKPPEEGEGQVVLYGGIEKASASEVLGQVADQCKLAVLACVKRPEEGTWVLHFKTRDEAASAIKQMCSSPREKRVAPWMQEAVKDEDGKERDKIFCDHLFNVRSYDDITKDGGRGWCVTEQGVALAVEAHIEAAEKSAAAKRWRGGASQTHRRLDRFYRQTRDKVTLLSKGGRGERVRCEHTPKEQLEKTQDNIEHAKFTGKSDRPKVLQQLEELVFTIREHFTCIDHLLCIRVTTLCLPPLLLCLYRIHMHARGLTACPALPAPSRIRYRAGQGRGQVRHAARDHAPSKQEAP
jgi:hypothetical protein